MMSYQLPLAQAWWTMVEKKRKALAEFRKQIFPCGFSLKASAIWLKPNSSYQISSTSFS
jgi:hypothetical protein